MTVVAFPTSLKRNSAPYSSSQISPPTPISSSSTSVRFLIKKHSSSSSSSSSSFRANHRRNPAASSEGLQRQLQQLFHLHDSGLDQSLIDLLPIFPYREILGPKEPFDCAVCLCEFAAEDRLRLLPLCGHAFHLSCIDTWLLSNSTCPLCRGVLFAPDDAVENPIFDFGYSSAEVLEQDEEIGCEKRVFSLRLGKFRNLSKRDSGDGDGNGDGAEDGNGDPTANNNIVRREEGESSSSNLDARRCFSMGSYQYVLGDFNLRVALQSGGNTNSARNEVSEGKRICVGSKGDSFSVSKIWQWSNNKGGKFPVISSSDASFVGESSPPMGRRYGDSVNVRELSRV
ncbi:RING-H2 finger protein ATL47-like [Ananas comosus]|uniref:RING-type E3 ubiquitin transferase n=1 Tax=Ananas comosus TaxID=4615 RepID=A0A6P5F8Q3_ANACO|nr:RING-H2 finger protein ATL47-like [Ananas comosus]